MAFSRSHLYVPLVNEAGDLRRYAKIRIYLDDGVTPYTGKIFRDSQSPRTYSNPWIVSPALVSVWLPGPMRIRLGISADQSKPEVLSDVYDVTPDGGETVTTVSPFGVKGGSTPLALLSVDPDGDGFWHPLRVDHEHEGVAPNTVRIGNTPLGLRQVETYSGSTTVGAQAGGVSSRSSLRDTSMLGLATDAYGRGTIAAGRSAYAVESDAAPWRGGAMALGRDAAAEDVSVALGALSNADGASSVAMGLRAQVLDDAGVALGPDSRSAASGIAIGARTGSTSRGLPGSIGIGAGAQYGLPGDLGPDHPAVLIGAFDPAAARPFPWSNPNSSQSESPLREFTPQMTFTGSTVQFQRQLRWLLSPVALRVAGDATLGGKGGTLGFYGKAPIAKPSIGDDEPNSGIPALDSLIYALRDLGLLDYRTEAVTAYQAEDLARMFLHGDKIVRWPEHNGTDVALPSGPAHPTLYNPDPDFNDYPVVTFDNGIYRAVTKPVQELRGANLLEETKHFIVVAQHQRTTFGFFEGMYNLSGGEVVIGDDTVFMSDTIGSTTWQTVNASSYYVDGLNQTANRSAQITAPYNKLPDPHVYRMTNRALWPHARPVIGGPRDQDAARNWDYFSGSISEIVGMDDTWQPNHVSSMERGLAFKYGIGQNPNSLAVPAANFLRTQHDPNYGCQVFWQRDYPDSYTGRCYGRVVNCPKPVIFVPFISIYIHFDFFSFRGSLLGNWGNIFGLSIDFEVEVSVAIGDFDGDGDFDTRVDIDYEFDARFETRVGSFSLNNNLTWSMGNFGCRTGYKVCRIRHRRTREIICMSGWPGSRYHDTEVRVYSTKPDGSLLLEGTSPLWGDGTFAVRVKNPGRKVARVYEKSTGVLLGTTEWQEKALPRTQLYALDDGERTNMAVDRAYVTPSAMSALAFTEMDNQYKYRSRHILRTLAGVANADGSLNDYYSASLPAQTPRPGGEAPNVRGVAWTILAVLRYQQVIGDMQFQPFADKLGSWLITQTPASTADKVLAYFAARDLGRSTQSAALTSYASAQRTSLLGECWISSTQRFARAPGDDREDLDADVLGGLFLIAIGERERARAVIRHLRRFRVKGLTVAAPHYAGPTGVIGYKPHAELGTVPWPNPPAIVDQPGTWAAVLFRTRFGEPIGDDVASMLRWQSTSIYGSGISGLYGAQFLRYSGSATISPYNLRARPHVLSAAWSYLMSQGARGLFLPDPLPVPTPTSLAVTSTFDRTAYRVVFRYSWLATAAGLTDFAAAYEAIPEFSVNAGQSWNPIANAAIVGQLIDARDPAGGTNAYAATWSVPVPENRATIYRVKLRMRNATFGSQVISPTVALPAIS